MSARTNLWSSWLPGLIAAGGLGALAFWAISQGPSWWTAGVAIAVVAGALGTAIAGNRVLERRVRERTEQLLQEGAARERAGAALDDREQSLASTLASMRDAMVVTDASGRIARLNGAAEALAGATTAQAFGRPIAEVFPLVDPESRQPVPSVLETVLAAPDQVGVGSEVLLRTDAGEVRLAGTGVPILSRGGELLGAVATLRDVTVEHARREQLREASQLEVVRQLAGGLAHDFNNLLAAIMGNAELLKTDKDDADALAVAEIVRASQRASSLTQQLLAFSREGGAGLDEADAHALIDEALEDLGVAALPRVRLERRLRAEPARVACDPAQLGGAVHAILENALEAMPAGGELQVSTRSFVPDRDLLLRHGSLEPVPHLEIRIRDSGTGMSAETRGRVFEPFFTTKRSPERSGLGLSSAWGVVRSHGGVIAVESEPGQGTTVQILLPARTSDAAPRHPGTAAVSHAGRILIVDDDDGVRTLSSRALEVLGYPVASCSDGVQALDFFAKHHRDVALVLLDLTMPRLSGESVFERMHAIDPSVPIVIVSGYVQSPKARALLDHGARGVLWKPFHIDELARLAEQYVATD